MPGSESHDPSRKPWRIPDDGLMATAYRLWQKTYAADYLGLIILTVFFLFIEAFIEPFHKLFSLRDLRISFPHAEIERVPVPWLFIYAGAIPLAIILGWLVVVRSEFQKAHITILGFFNSVLLTLFVTDVIKNAVGRPRPDLLDRCQPAPGTSGDELVSIDVCTETRHHTLQDGWRSFPSGHSSFAFAGLGYLALFLASQTYVFRPRSDLARFLLVLAPLLGAALIAISRLEDYRHDVFDVVCGSLLGLAIAYSTWRRHYPSLSSAACDTPYAVLTEANVTKSGFSRIRDEEAVVGDARQFELDSDVDERYAFAGQRSHA